MAAVHLVNDADIDRFYVGLSRLLRTYQFRDRDRQTICGITATQCYALDFLIEAGRLTVQDLARRLALNKSNGSRVVDALLSGGLVLRTSDPGDSRIRWIEPTREGRARHARITGDLKRDYATLLAPFGATFVRDMTRVLDALSGRACPPAGPAPPPDPAPRRLPSATRPSSRRHR